MYVLDYLIYHLRPYGIVGHSQPLPNKVSLAEIVHSDDLSKTTERPSKEKEHGQSEEKEESNLLE